jgi:hypothetical protein
MLFQIRFLANDVISNDQRLALGANYQLSPFNYALYKSAWVVGSNQLIVRSGQLKVFSRPNVASCDLSYSD